MKTAPEKITQVHWLYHPEDMDDIRNAMINVEYIRADVAQADKAVLQANFGSAHAQLAEYKEVSDQRAEDLTAALIALSRVAIESHDSRQQIKDAERCLLHLGNYWRADWSDFDGRTLRSQLDSIIKVMEGKETADEFCDEITHEPN
jgi:hypothetical protein